MKFRDLFHVFRHPEREAPCHELTDEEREAAVKRVDAMLAKQTTLMNSQGVDKLADTRKSE